MTELETMAGVALLASLLVFWLRDVRRRRDCEVFRRWCAAGHSDDARGPKCPCCRGPLISYSSMNIRECVDCGHMYSWDLDPGQKPLVTNNRHDRKEQAQ